MVRTSVSASSEHETRRRSTDNDMWMRTAYLLDKYKIIVYFLCGGLVYLGFQVTTPLQRIDNLEKGQAIIASRVDAADAQRNVIIQKLDLITVISCLNIKTELERNILRQQGIRCSLDSLTNSRPR